MQPPLESFIAVMQLTVGSMKTPPCDYANWPSAKPFRNCIKSQGTPALSIPRFFCMCVFKIQRGKQQNGKGEFLLFFFCLDFLQISFPLWLRFFRRAAVGCVAKVKQMNGNATHAPRTTTTAATTRTTAPLTPFGQSVTKREAVRQVRSRSQRWARDAATWRIPAPRPVESCHARTSGLIWRCPGGHRLHAKYQVGG